MLLKVLLFVVAFEREDFSLFLLFLPSRALSYNFVLKVILLTIALFCLSFLACWVLFAGGWDFSLCSLLADFLVQQSILPLTFFQLSFWNLTALDFRFKKGFGFPSPFSPSSSWGSASWSSSSTWESSSSLLGFGFGLAFEGCFSNFGFGSSFGSSSSVTSPLSLWLSCFFISFKNPLGNADFPIKMISTNWLTLRFALLLFLVFNSFSGVVPLLTF